MNTYSLKFTLQSDAAFARGDGLAGIVDSEVQHDELGCPFLSGREIKGILAEECADILYSLPHAKKEVWEIAAARLFGKAGSSTGDTACWSYGDARLPSDLHQALEKQRDEILSASLPEKTDSDYYLRMRQIKEDFRREILASLTTIRRQTAMDSKTGAPKDHSLRAMRVVLRETPFEAELVTQDVPGSQEEAQDLALLSACVRAFRRAGTGRNRGKGRLAAVLCGIDESPLNPAFEKFVQEVLL